MTPNLFLIAAPRAGSTQLSRWLDSHTDISLPKIKEPNHFSAHEFDPVEVRKSYLNDVDPARFIARDQPVTMQFAVFRDPVHYEALFAPLKTRYRLDASTSYLSCPEAPALIHTAHPDARLIMLTRDPLNRALSHYHLARRTGRTRAPLAAELANEVAARTPLSARYLLRPSRQNEAVACYRAVFPQSQLLELTFEQMIADPTATLERIAAWLRINPKGFDLTTLARNESAAPRLPVLNAALHKSGLKTALRAALPHGFKQRLKPLWFGAPLPEIPQSDIAALQKALTP